MRVTKLIREYVTNEVNKKFPIEDKNHPFNVVHNKLCEKAQEINDKVEDFVNNLIKELNLPQGFYCDTTRYNAIRYGHSYVYDECPSFGDYQKWVQEQKTKREKYITDILLTLELGGTKADLEKMLNGIEEEDE